MDAILKDKYIPSLTAAEAGSYSPLVLAFVGDSFYEQAIRTMFVLHGNARPNDLNRKKNRLVSAEAQSAMTEVLLPLLTEEEEKIYRRGRNARSYTSAKNASITDYRRATGFEALIGYLYLTGRTERAYELIDAAIGALPDPPRACPPSAHRAGAASAGTNRRR